MPIFWKDASVVGDIIRLGAERTLVQISIMTLDVVTVLSLGKADYFICPHPIQCMHTCTCATFNGFTIQGRGGYINLIHHVIKREKGDKQWLCLPYGFGSKARNWTESLEFSLTDHKYFISFASWESLGFFHQMRIFHWVAGRSSRFCGQTMVMPSAANMPVLLLWR